MRGKALQAITKLKVGRPSLVPRPLPDFYLAAVEKSQLQEIPSFLHSCEIKSGSGLGMRPGLNERDVLKIH